MQSTAAGSWPRVTADIIDWYTSGHHSSADQRAHNQLPTIFSSLQTLVIKLTSLRQIKGFGRESEESDRAEYKIISLNDYALMHNKSPTSTTTNPSNVLSTTNAAGTTSTTNTSTPTKDSSLSDAVIDTIASKVSNRIATVSATKSALCTTLDSQFDNALSHQAAEYSDYSDDDDEPLYVPSSSTTFDRMQSTIANYLTLESQPDSSVPGVPSIMTSADTNSQDAIAAPNIPPTETPSNSALVPSSTRSSEHHAQTAERIAEYARLTCDNFLNDRRSHRSDSLQPMLHYTNKREPLKSPSAIQDSTFQPIPKDRNKDRSQFESRRFDTGRPRLARSGNDRYIRDSRERNFHKTSRESRTISADIIHKCTLGIERIDQFPDKDSKLNLVASLLKELHAIGIQLQENYPNLRRSDLRQDMSKARQDLINTAALHQLDLLSLRQLAHTDPTLQAGN